jgi:integrase
MTRPIHRLTARQVTALGPGVHSDGGGLYLQVTVGADGNLCRSWLFKYELDGKRREMGLGPTYTIALAEAREQARGHRRQLLSGISPLAIRQAQHAERLASQAERARTVKFDWCFEQCLAAHEDGWRNAEHRKQWESSVRTYALPMLGSLPVDEITTPHIIKVLEPIWKTKPETASRVRGRVERVLAWATVRGFRSGDNPARWRNHLQEMFPARGKIAPTKPHAALPYTDMPALLSELNAIDHPAARALKFVTVTCARTDEALGATWDEFDLIAKVWTIPGSRTKNKKEHRVPLSDLALEILGVPTSDRVFPIGEIAMRMMLKRVRSGITVHGLRSSFRDWASERTNYPTHIAELCLAHSIGSKVERAYHRSDLFDKRRRLMAEWAAWCSRPVPTGATVTALARVPAVSP